MATTTIRPIHEPVPAWMRHPGMAGARFVEGAAGATATAGSEGSTGAAAQQPAGDQQQGQAGQATPPTPPAAQDAQQATPDPQGGEQGGEQGQPHPWDDPNTARAEIERLRRENGAARTNAKQAAAQEARDSVVTQIGKALGLIQDDKGQAPTVEDLTSQVASSRDDARTARVELAIYKAAATHDADPAALLDSRAFLAKVADLDPTADDFGTKVSDAIKAQVETNPKLKAAGQAPSRSGGEINNGHREPAKGQSPEELAALIRKNRKY